MINRYEVLILSFTEQFQNLLALAGSNLGQPGVACDYTVPCVLPFAGMKERNISSIVLVTNGVSKPVSRSSYICIDFCLHCFHIDLFRDSSCTVFMLGIAS